MFLHVSNKYVIVLCLTASTTATVVGACSTVTTVLPGSTCIMQRLLVAGCSNKFCHFELNVLKLVNYKLYSKTANSTLCSQHLQHRRIMDSSTSDKVENNTTREEDNLSNGHSEELPQLHEDDAEQVIILDQDGK